MARREGAAPRVLARAFQHLGTLTFWKGDLVRAETLAREALALYEQIGDLGGRSLMMHHLGISGALRGIDPRELWEGSLALAREATNPVLTSGVLGLLAGLLASRGERERAAGLFDEALTLARGAGDRWHLSNIYVQLAEAEFVAGHNDRAEEMGREGLGFAMEVGHRFHLLKALLLLAEIARARGDPQRDAMLLGAAERFAETFAPGPVPGARFDWETVKALPGYSSAWAKGRALTLEQAVAYARDPSATESAR
jgi:tetratricopeptide (TPR) repeat protein